MKAALLLFSLFTILSLPAHANEVLTGKVSGATGYLARDGYTDCTVEVLAQDKDSLTVNFTLTNGANGEAFTLSNLRLSKEGRVGLITKMTYDLGADTAPELIDDPSIVPQAHLYYENLVKLQDGAIDYHLSEIRTNGEFYGNESYLRCQASNPNSIE